MSATEVKKFITKYKYGQQNVWLWYFYALIPEQQLSAEWATDLLNYLEEPDVGLEKSPYRKLDLLRKYERIEPKIICKALRIVSNHYEESPFVFSLYVFWMLNHSNQQGAYKILHEFSNELALLEEVYLKGVSYSNHEDYDGTLLCVIISVDIAFLYRYLDCIISVQRDRVRLYDNYAAIRLLRIWDTEQFIDLADDVFDYVHENRERSVSYTHLTLPTT